MVMWATGIFTSIDEGLGASLDAVRNLGVESVQLHAPSGYSRTPNGVREISKMFSDANIEISVVFVGFPEDDYSTVEKVKETVGLVPSTDRSKRLSETLDVANFAKALGVDAIGMHLGFVPEDHTDLAFAEIVETTRIVCDHCAGNDQFFHLETGQETAKGLMQFIEAVDRVNLAVNFDPANMILYGSGDPLEALETVAPFVRSVHCKDAKYERQVGQPWYEDAPLGEGDVDIEAFLSKLYSLGYRGPLTIEREYSPDQKGDIAAALELLHSLRTKIFG
ncbi:MAG: sugar phosphate isomerase/epimerase family protein [Candidatus Latescibacterota bacterium]|nr:sugar phosphate isomerase/epimerase family protein [Candidatus Latescibacterota bacterium]